MQKIAVITLLALMVVAAVATEVDTEVDAEKRGKKTATRLVVGNAMIRLAQLCVTRSARVPNVRCSVNRPNVQNALYTASSRNALFVARKTCARKTLAPNVKPCVPRLNATPRVSPRKRIVLRYVRRLRARGLVPNRRLVRALNVSYNAPNRRVMLKTNRNVANVEQKALNAQ